MSTKRDPLRVSKRCSDNEGTTIRRRAIASDALWETRAKASPRRLIPRKILGTSLNRVTRIPEITACGKEKRMNKICQYDKRERTKQLRRGADVKTRAEEKIMKEARRRRKERPRRRKHKRFWAVR